VSRFSWFQLGYRTLRGQPKAAGVERGWWLALIALIGCGFAHAQPAAKELHVAAAADLQPVLPVLAERYEKATGTKIVASYGSSSTLATQILNGAPVDLFLSADFVFPEKIVAAGLADGTAPTQYAKGTLVLWARKDSPLQPISLDTLMDKRVASVAIANDLHAPYGQAAVAALKRMHMYDQVKPHLVIAENISQAAQFVESGNAQLGMISLTAASSSRFQTEGTFVRVPTSSYAPLVQCAVVIAKSKMRADAHAFLDWILKPEIQALMGTMGLEPVK
jgi:molybdenum ABC transporter, periplasmic molybdate-binding protein